MAVNSISISHQNSIVKTPFIHFISLWRWAVRTTNLFRQLLPKGEDLQFQERIHLPVFEESSAFRRHKISIVAVHVTSVRCIEKHIFLMTAIIFWNFPPKVLKIYDQVFFNSENLLSSIGQCTWLHLYFPFGSFI